MKYKLLLAFITLFTSVSANAQDYSGYRSGNYTGVNSVFFNPANIADSRYRFDINLFSVNATVGNNQASFSLKDIGKSFDTDSLENKIFGANAGRSSGFVSTDFHGPSFMFNAGKKNAVAFTSRARVLANVTDIDGKLVSKISDDFNTDVSLPYTVASGEAMRFAVNGWTEFGVSFARVLRDKDQHFLKGGITLKYLAGAANGYFNLSSFSGTINNDAVNDDYYLSNATGRMSIGFGGVRISDLEPSELLEMKSTGFGADIGFVYEYRPEHQKFRSEDGKGWKRGQNKYKFKVGLALLDIGRIKYERDMERSGAYSVNITGNERFYLSELDSAGIDNYKDLFNSRPQFFTAETGNNDATYNVGLPSTLQVDVDYNVHKNVYVSLGSQFSLVNTNEKVFNSNYFTNFTLTPRYEGKTFGFYVPLTYNALTKFTAGTSFRLGPLFVGSGSVLSSLLGDSKQVDVHLGLRFGSLHQ